MHLTQLLPIEGWAELEREWSARSGLTPAVYDLENKRLTAFANWANELCPALRQSPQALTGICAVAQQGLAAMARSTRRPVVEECDAGLVKIVAPVFVGDELIGTVSGCGRRYPESDMDFEYLAQSSGLTAEALREKAPSVAAITPEEAAELAAFLSSRIGELTRG